MTGSRVAWRATVLGVVTGVVAVLATLGQAASPAFWRVSTQAEFLRGDVENISVDADGQLRLGPKAELVYETTAPFLWSVVRYGESLWVGSGNDGKVFRVGLDGTAAIVFEAREQNVHAVVPAGDVDALIGTSPDGSVLRVTADSAQTVFDPEDKYIWALAVDDDGNIFVATGNQGRIYRVSPAGDSSLFYDTEATHVLALAFDPEGNLVAGTASPGQVFRISPDGRAFVVLDSPFDEIRALHSAPDGTLYAVAVGQSPGRSRPAPTPTPTRPAGVPTVSTSTTVTAIVVADATPTRSPATQTSSASGATDPRRGAVYRIYPDGVWDTVWESTEDLPYDASIDTAGNLLIGTGESGKIFQIADDPPTVVLLTRAPAAQVISFASGPDGAQYYVTANPGRIYRLTAERASEGTYVSEVRDAKTVATWGTVSWRATTPGDSGVRLFTRSGNTGTPNETWSRWSDAYTDPTGSQIASPKARYVQWKAELYGTRDTPALLSVTTAYLPRNLRPEITSLTVHDPGIVFQRPLSSGDPPIAGLDDRVDSHPGSDDAGSSGDAPQTTLGRRMYRKGLRTFVWRARDQNQDGLEFDVLYRSETGSTWQTLRTGITDSIFTWNTTSAPDGAYLIRIVASDAGSNAPGTALTGVAESPPFDVDNSPPSIEMGTLRMETNLTFIPFVVTDRYSPVRNVEYSVDTKRWQVIYPLDGISDSRVERFEVAVAPADADRLVIRATDAMNNAATAAGP